VFNISCTSLIGDLERAASRFVAALQSSEALRANAEKFAAELTTYKLRTI